MLTFTVDCMANLIVRSLTDADQRLLCRKSVVYNFTGTFNSLPHDSDYLGT